jgi:hypothetical protein
LIFHYLTSATWRSDYGKANCKLPDVPGRIANSAQRRYIPLIGMRFTVFHLISILSDLIRFLMRAGYSFDSKFSIDECRKVNKEDDGGCFVMRIRFAWLQAGTVGNRLFIPRIGIYLARQGIHIHRINAENINQSPLGDLLYETPYGVLVWWRCIFFY